RGDDFLFRVVWRQVVAFELPFHLFHAHVNGAVHEVHDSEIQRLEIAAQMEMIVDFLGVLEELYPESVRAHVFDYATVPHGDQMDAHKSFKRGGGEGKKRPRENCREKASEGNCERLR